MAEDTIANLARLSEKPGVRATLVLSRQNGDIVRCSGLESQHDTDDSITNGQNDDEGANTGKLAPVEEIAKLVFEHVKASAAMAKVLNGTADDDLKLVRIRTKRNELVIVPGE